jgi:hypothetical protein
MKHYWSRLCPISNHTKMRKLIKSWLSMWNWELVNKFGMKIEIEKKKWNLSENNSRLELPEEKRRRSLHRVMWEAKSTYSCCVISTSKIFISISFLFFRRTSKIYIDQKYIISKYNYFYIFFLCLQLLCHFLFFLECQKYFDNKKKNIKNTYTW